MAERSRGLLFRKRNILGTALIAGIGLGVYFGQFKGCGSGGNGFMGMGSGTGETHVSLGTTEVANQTSEPSKSTVEEDVSIPVPDVVRVLIDDRQFLLRGKGDSAQDVPISLTKLIDLIKKAPGDSDGFRVRIYEKANARMKEEESLKEALVAAGINDSAVLWVPTPVK